MCGDSRDDTYGVFLRILAAVEDSDMEFLLHLEDLERPGGRRSWERFRQKTGGFSKPLYLVVGNHELRGGTRKEFVRFFGRSGTSHSFDHRGAHFVLPDNADGTLPPEPPGGTRRRAPPSVRSCSAGRSICCSPRTNTCSTWRIGEGSG